MTPHRILVYGFRFTDDTVEDSPITIQFVTSDAAKINDKIRTALNDYCMVLSLRGEPGGQRWMDEIVKNDNILDVLQDMIHDNWIQLTTSMFVVGDRTESVYWCSLQNRWITNPIFFHLSVEEMSNPIPVTK